MTLKIAVFALIPSASVNTAIAVKAGYLINIRKPNLRSSQNVSMTHLTRPRGLQRSPQRELMENLQI